MPAHRLKIARRCFLGFVVFLGCFIVFDFGQKLRTPISSAVKNWRASTKVTWATFLQIRQGMSYDEVKGILGREPDAGMPDMPPQLPIAGATRVEHWSHETDVITVWFDVNEHVLATSYCCEVTLLDQAWLWLQRLM